MVLQHESSKRLASEQRLHSQLLLQSETMVVMELKLLRLEAKVERSEAFQRQQQHVPTTRGDVGAVQLSQREPTSTLTSSGMEQTNFAMVGSSVGDGDESERKGRINSSDEIESQQSSEWGCCRVHACEEMH
jgi:hypothetical protein